MNQPQMWLCPPDPEPLFHLGCLRAPALGVLLHAATLHWSYRLYMVNFYDIVCPLWRKPVFSIKDYR